jgi:hypothetical protein
MVCILTGTLCISGCFVGEKSLIDRIVDHSDGASRRAAAHLRTVSAAVLQGAATIDGIDLSSQQLSTPEGKAFPSLFPFSAISTDHLFTKTERVLGDVLRWSAIKAIGTPEDAYNQTFVPSVKRLGEQKTVWESLFKSDHISIYPI